MTHCVGSAFNGSQRSPWRTELQDGERWENVKDFKDGVSILTKNLQSCSIALQIKQIF